MYTALIAGAILGLVVGIPVGYRFGKKLADDERRKMEDEIRQLRYQAVWNVANARANSPHSVV